MAKSDIAGRIRPLCQRLADEMSFELVDVSLDREPAGKYLRVYIDRAGGMDLDGCEAFHRRLQPLVEDYDYDFLECCSPGADRPLKTDADYERALGLEVEAKLFRAADGIREARGILAAWTPADFTLEMPDGGEKTFGRKDCASVRPVVDMTGVEDVEL